MPQPHVFRPPIKHSASLSLLIQTSSSSSSLQREREVGREGERRATPEEERPEKAWNRRFQPSCILAMALDDDGVDYSSSCSCSNRRHEYDVFLSFRGDVACESFTDHLYATSCCNELITFRDEEELERGEVMKPSLLQAIQESFSAIVVLSKTYANSTWCLHELLEILHSKKELGLHVFPIIYRVDPSNVWHQTESFAEAFQKHEQKFAYDKVQRWRGALKEVAGIAGWNSQDYR